MSAKHPIAGAQPPHPHSKRLRVTGAVVLLLGLAIAGAVYGIRTRAGEPAEEELLAENATAESRQMEVLYGRMGLLTKELSEDLTRPGTQTLIIATVSILVAGGCFYFARLEDDDHEVR